MCGFFITIILSNIIIDTYIYKFLMRNGLLKDQMKVTNFQTSILFIR